MRIHVIRGEGVRQAPSIVDPMLSNTAVAIQRGRNTLDATGSNKKHIELVMPYRLMPATGSILEVMDGQTSEIYKAKLTGYSYSVTAPTENSPLKIVARATLERSMT